MEKQDTYVFISYSSANRQDALSLYSSLTNRVNRLTCWMDVFDLIPDEETFQQQIVHGIRNASGFVLVDTEEARSSDYVSRELAAAETHGIPVFRSRVRTRKNALLQGLRILTLAARIKSRITQPFWVSILVLAAVLAAMALGVYALSNAVTPVVVEAYERILPGAIRPGTASSEMEDPDPKAAAPFYFSPDRSILEEEFESGVELNPQFHYEIQPAYEGVEIFQQEGVLNLTYPAECYLDEFMWACETEIQSHQLDLPEVQYVGIRVRSLIQTAEREISISLSTSTPDRRRTGFGWGFADHATPFFRSNLRLPEADFYAYVPLDQNWHAYEILMDPDTAVLYYYVDGQMIDSFSMQNYQEWKQAPVVLMIYVASAGSTGQADDPTALDLSLAVDQILIGGFDDQGHDGE